MMLRLLSSAADAMDLRVLTLGPAVGFQRRLVLTRISLSAVGPPLKGICRVDRMPEQPHHGAPDA
jgi:hypothetical protein